MIAITCRQESLQELVNLGYLESVIDCMPTHAIVMVNGTRRVWNICESLNFNDVKYVLMPSESSVCIVDDFENVGSFPLVPVLYLFKKVIFQNYTIALALVLLTWCMFLIPTHPKVTIFKPDISKMIENKWITMIRENPKQEEVPEKIIPLIAPKKEKAPIKTNHYSSKKIVNDLEIDPLTVKAVYLLSSHIEKCPSKKD